MLYFFSNAPSGAEVFGSSSAPFASCGEWQAAHPRE